jgi:hypothetical protein
MNYKKFSLVNDAELAFNYLTRMNDPERDYLPYWLVGYDKYPAWAKHCRVDDAELVASWLDGLMCCREIMGTETGVEVEKAYQRHLMKSWGPKGLRYHEKYPWTQTIHSQFHEMSYVLSALNRWLASDPDNREVEEKAAGLVRGMRELVIERKRKTFWSGDSLIEEKVYEWPNDVYLPDRGWDYSCITGRGEFPVRNGIVLHALVRRWQLFDDDVALDLATGLANYILGISRYFNWKGEYFGHVHSTVWVAQGLILLGRLTDNDRYLTKGKQIYDYTVSISSSFGWVPEYGQWHPEHMEVCETCCIRDMIECALELVDAGFPEYYDLANRFVRNQLSEQQLKEAPFVSCDNSREDDENYTFRDIDKRIIGGYSGGSGPHSIEAGRFRSVAGCCVGTAPQALYRVWENIVKEDTDGYVYINFPIDHIHELARVETDYPNTGKFCITVGKPGNYRVRIYDFMKRPDLKVLLNDSQISFDQANNLLELNGLQAGDEIKIQHELPTVICHEQVMGQTLEVVWRGCDVVDILPHGAPLRLYQKTLDQEKVFPPKPEADVNAEVHEIEVFPTDPV